MTVFGLNHLRCTYSRMLRLWGKSNRPQWTGALSENRFSTFRRSHVCTVCIWDVYHRRYAVSTTHANTNVRDTANNFPEAMKENEYARNLFVNSFGYERSVVLPHKVHTYVTNEEALKLLEQDWSLMRNDDMVTAVKKLSYNIQYSEKSIDAMEYEDALKALSVQSEKMSDDNLMVIMKHLMTFKIQFAEHKFYHKLCDKLDRECVMRFTQLPINDMLLLCDMLYQLNHKPTSQYIWYAMRKLGNKPGKLSPQQLVQVLFFLNVCRKPPINMYELEFRLGHCLDELSVNELGIAALGFFKTGTQIRSPELLNRIIRKTITEVDIVDSVSIGGILKLIRHSMKLTEISTLKLLLSTLIPHVPRFTLMSIIHIAHACAKVTLYDKELMDKIIKRLNSELKNARLKDIERLIFVFATFNIDPNHSIYHNVIEELRTTWDTSRANEITGHSHVVSRILGFLSYVNIYPTDLIKRIMASEYIHRTCHGNYHFISREYCVLDYSLRLEVPDYDGPFLKSTTLNFLVKKYSVANVTDDLNRTNVLLSSVLDTCQEIFNNTSNILVDRPLPHYITPDIIICLNEKNELVSSEKFLSEFSETDIKRVDKERWKNLRWIALVVAPHAVLIRDTNLFTGLFSTKIRQLSIIGYTPIVILQNNWYEYRTMQERSDYIKSLIFANNVSESANI